MIQTIDPPPQKKSVLVFNPSTGTTTSNKTKAIGDGFLHLYKGWVPYFTIDGKYIGFKAGNAFFSIKAKNYMKSYWDLLGDINDMQ